jgi:hypothetical protein
MADGANDGTVQVRFHHGENWILIDDEDGATNTGTWMDASEFSWGSVEIIISDTATVQLMGLDIAAKPTDATDGRQIGSDITATQLYSLEHPPRWIKAKVSAWSAGTVDVRATLRRSS